MKGGESSLSRRIARDYPSVSEAINRAARRGRLIKIVLEDGSGRYYRGRHAPTPENAGADETLVVDLREHPPSIRK